MSSCPAVRPQVMLPVGLRAGAQGAGPPLKRFGTELGFLQRPNPCQPAPLPAYLPASLSASHPACLFACLPTSLPLSLSACLSVCLPVCLPVSPSLHAGSSGRGGLDGARLFRSALHLGV